MCFLRGDPLLLTPDGNMIQLVGPYKFTLSKWMVPDEECSFNIEVKEKEIGETGIVYPRYVTVEMYGLAVTMHQDGSVTVSVFDY